MNEIETFLAGLVLAFAVSLLAVLLLRPHLANLLAELCGSQARAGFWWVVSSLCILLFGILAGTLSYGYPDTANPSGQQLFFALVSQVRASLIGLLVSLLVVSWLLLGFIRRFEEGASPAPLRPAQPVPSAPSQQQSEVAP